MLTKKHNTVIQKRHLSGETRNGKFANEGRKVSGLTYPNNWGARGT
jgi:hypothetical protein